MLTKNESAPPLECTYVRRNGAAIVDASGEVDLGNIHLLAEMLDVALGDSRAIIVDFTEVSNIDSTGLNALVRLHEQCARRKTNVAIVFTSRNLWRMFSVLSLQDMFRIFPTVDAALWALSHRLNGSGDARARGEQPTPFGK